MLLEAEEAEFLLEEVAVEFVARLLQLLALHPGLAQLVANLRPASPVASRTGCRQMTAFVPWPCRAGWSKG